MNAQTIGVVLLAVAGALLWSAWSLVIAGALLVLLPEVVAMRTRRAVRRRWSADR